MSIWGKIVGGMAGFMAGGPIGALIGGLAGHVIDSQRIQSAPPNADPDRLPAVFSVALIALGAKMAKADGRVTRDEVDAFKRVFQIAPQDMKAVGHVFDVAKQDVTGYEEYAHQVAQCFGRSPAVLEQLLHALFVIATADGVLHRDEISFLARVASIFGFGDDDFARIRAVHEGSAAADPADAYAVLGVPQSATDAEVRAAYRKLAREGHPDKLVADGMPEEFVTAANDRMAQINAAYREIRTQRGM